MIKFREAKYCNLKLFLLFLVIYGHLIESKIYNIDILMVQYKWIYLVHMPLFCFLSGLFISREKGSLVQFKKTFILYIVLQTLAVIHGKGTVKIYTPWWILWYLLSYSVWSYISYLWYKFLKGNFKFIILIASIAVGCLAGFFPYVGRAFSLSRTLVFFPYFWAGIISKPSFDWKKLRILEISLFIVVFVIMLYIGDEIPVAFLYQASPYEKNDDVLLRFICYLLSGSLGLFLLTVCPTKRFPFSKIGATTMLPYLLHAPVVMILRDLDIQWHFYIVLSIAFLYIIHKLTRWRGTLYGIVSAERRDNSCQSFNKSMKNMLSRFIDFYYP